jgi:N-acyl-D-amino-acid deacylase
MKNLLSRREVLTTLLTSFTAESLASRVLANQPGNGVDEGPHPRRARRDFSAVEPLMDQFIQEHRIAGASMAIALQGRLVSNRGYGFADVATHRPVTPETVFSIASVTKSFTAVGVLKLVEQRKLNLDARIVELLPMRNAPLADPRFRRITVHQLLFHGGGLARDAKEGGADSERDSEEAYRWLRGQRLLFDPGTEHRYSNAGFIVLRLVIERASGEKYQSFISQHILQPMGITRMHLESERGYEPDETRRYQPGGQHPAHRNAGNWLATSEDLVRFVSSVAGSGGSSFLQAETTALMLEYPPSLREPGNRKRGAGHVGLGWDTVEKFGNGRYRFSKNGGKPGVQAWLEHLETGIDWAFLFNTGAPKEGPAPMGQARKLMYQAFGQILGRT